MTIRLVLLVVACVLFVLAAGVKRLNPAAAELRLELMALGLACLALALVAEGLGR